MIKHTVIGAALLMAVTGAANALTITGSSATCAAGNAVPAGITCGSADRRNLDNVELSSTGDGDFFSLGLGGGSASFWISPNFTGPLSAIEVTFGRNSYPTERAVVEARLNNGAYTTLGTITSRENGGSARLEFSGIFDEIRFTDASDMGGEDGFDLDAFNVAAVPLPAAGMLLLAGMGGLGGLGALRRRKAKA